MKSIMFGVILILLAIIAYMALPDRGDWVLEQQHDRMDFRAAVSNACVQDLSYIENVKTGELVLMY